MTPAFAGWLHFYLRHKRDRWFTFSAHRDKRPMTTLWHASTLQGASAPLS